MAMICPTCGNRYARLIFRDDLTKAAGYRCTHCTCSFIVIREGEIPELEYDDDEEHTKDRWPY